jgi:hypothetical protein
MRGRPQADHRREPRWAHISTSYAEGQNLTMRMHMRRFTRLTSAFSKKVEDHMHMVALYTVFYNWTRIHKTLRGDACDGSGPYQWAVVDGRDYRAG